MSAVFVDVARTPSERAMWATSATITEWSR